jgi:conjugal transfer pilus assembly protein TraV
MKKFQNILILLGVVVLSGCSSMNSKFSCNVTAGDSCLSMDDVNAMTENQAPIRARPIPQNQHHPLLKAQVKRVWIAPWSDSKGVKHQGELVYVPELSEGASA